MRLSEQEKRRRWTRGGGATVFIIVAFFMVKELWMPGNFGWNAFLIVFSIALAIAGFLLNRYFAQHDDEIGEARFDTRTKSDLNG